MTWVHGDREERDWRLGEAEGDPGISELLLNHPQRSEESLEGASSGEGGESLSGLPGGRCSWVSGIKGRLFLSMLALVVVSLVGALFVGGGIRGMAPPGSTGVHGAMGLVVLGLSLLAVLFLFYRVLASHIEEGLKELHWTLKGMVTGEETPWELPEEFSRVVETCRGYLGSVKEDQKEKELINGILTEAVSAATLRGFCRKAVSLVASYGRLELVRLVGMRSGGKGWETLSSFPFREEGEVERGVGEATILFFRQGRIWGGLEVAPMPPLSEISRWNRIAHSLAVAMASVSYRERVDQLSLIDELTGFYNRRHLFVSIQREINRAHRYRHPFSLVMIDIDDFKQVNDTYGHAAGDGVLMEIGRLVKASIRASDQPFRFGGEEFVLLLPDTPLEGAERVAERLVGEVREREMDLGGVSIRLTISAGVASYRPGDTPSTLLKKADDALYKAKREGKNRFVVHKEEV